MARARRDEGRGAATSSGGPWLLVALALFLAGFLIGSGRHEPLTPATTAAEMPTAVAVFGEAWDLLHEHYVDPAALDDRKLLTGALRGLVEAVGDNGHTRYLTPEELAQHGEQLSGEYTGVGIEIVGRDGRIVVSSVFDDSPAQRAGVRVGDVLVAVDGIPVDDLALDEVVQRVRGPEGTPVTLRFERVGMAAPLEMTLVRAKVRIIQVRWALLPGDVGLIRLSSFASGASEETATALDRLTAMGARAIILDLRGNPGGLVDEAIAVAGAFLPPDTVVFRSRDRQGNETVYRTESAGRPTDLPLVVLVDRGSASAAEIVAGALQDHRRAVVMGETTFGTGTVLIEFRLRDGSALLIGTQVWVTPQGRVIWRNGIEPDIPVSLAQQNVPFLPSDHVVESVDAFAHDNQLVAAWRFLTGLTVESAIGQRGCLQCR